MKALVVSGIWPPEVGGPASHAPELAEYLLARGHGVAAVTSADRAPAPERYRVAWVSRRTPRGVRHLHGALTVARLARSADVVYSTGMLVRSALACAAVGRPLVVKLTSDPSYERSLRYGLSQGDLAEYQETGGARVGALRRTRDWALGRAEHVVVPSDALRGHAIRWGVAPDRITLLPNPIGAPAGLVSRAEARARFQLERPTLVFAGRLVPVKRLDVALRALAVTEGVDLVLAGDGPEESSLRALTGELGLTDRVRFLGAQPRATVFELLRAGDAAVLSSNWENFPHMAVEALVVGTPLVASGVGGVREIVRDGETGLLVPPGDVDALAAAIRRLFGDDGLRDRLAAAAPASVERFAPERVYRELEAILARAART
jgi:glycosyltransferase involved in cell wall biosynthesis